jgi:hypothetical protein
MLGVVAHDAGAAEIISSHLRQQGSEFTCTLEGAARHVFERKFGLVETVALEELIERSHWILCGTSFLSDLEWRAIALARSAGKRVVAVLDHWINYRQRFFRHGQWAFPDEVWVGDELGLARAGQEVPEAKAVLVPNAYFQDIQKELATIPASERSADAGEVLLYVCEPLREDGLALYNDPLYWGYTEEDALRYFLSNVGRISSRVERIIVRPHPQEARDKYLWAADEYDLPIVTGENKTLLVQVVESDVVVGCATMAMVVGLLAGKRVVSCIPPGAKTQPLPHATIERI